MLHSLLILIFFFFFTHVCFCYFQLSNFCNLTAAFFFPESFLYQRNSQLNKGKKTFKKNIPEMLKWKWTRKCSLTKLYFKMQCRPGSGQVCHETLLWRQSASCGSAISEKVSLPSNVVSSLTPEWTLSLVSLHYIFKAALIDFNGLRGAVEGTANKVWTFKNRLHA